jgi:predicted outer membrane repeat protein
VTTSFDNAVFYANTARIQGGAIDVKGGILTCHNVSFSNNEAVVR